MGAFFVLYTTDIKTSDNGQLSQCSFFARDDNFYVITNTTL